MQNNIENISDETNLIDVIHRIWEKKYFILISSLIIYLLIFILSQVFFTKWNIECRIDTKNLNLIINSILNSKTFFSRLEYNKFILPIDKRNQEIGVTYNILIGDKDKKYQKSIVDERIYSIILQKSLIKKKDKSSFQNDISDFFNILRSVLFEEFVWRSKNRRNHVIFKISKLNKKKYLLIRQINAVNKYVNKKNQIQNFVDTNYPYPSYLPPNQQFVGLNIEKNNVDITLEDLDNELNSLNFLINYLKSHLKTDLFEILEQERIKSFRDLYSVLKLIKNEIESIHNESLKKCYISKNRIFSFKYMVFFLFFVPILMSFLGLFFEWIKRFKNYVGS